MYSVETEEEAKKLVGLVCPRGLGGDYVAPDLVEDQTLENLAKFSHRLDRGYKLMKEKRKHG